MNRTSCVVIEDNILEFLDEIETQLGKGIICCKCQNPCDKKSRCAVAMRNLLTDIDLFKKSYSEVNKVEIEEQNKTLTVADLDVKVEPKEEKQVFVD